MKRDDPVPVEAVLGKLHDRIVGSLFSLSVAQVFYLRKKLGIPAYGNTQTSGNRSGKRGHWPKGKHQNENPLARHVLDDLRGFFDKHGGSAYPPINPYSRKQCSRDTGIHYSALLDYLAGRSLPDLKNSIKLKQWLDAARENLKG